MKKQLSNLLFLIATVIWGFAFVAQKEAAIIPAFTVGAIRSLFAVVFLILIIPLSDKLTKNGRRLISRRGGVDFNRRELIGGVILGVILVVASAFQQIGIEKTDAGKAAFITALYVVLVPIFSAFLGKRPTLNSIVSVPIAVVGFYFLCIKPGASLEVADLLMLMCAIIFATHIITVDRMSPGCDGFRMSCVQFATAFLLNTVVALIFEPPISMSAVSQTMPSLLFLGILSSGIGYTLQIVGQKNADPTVAAVILSMESVFGVIGAAFILGERMDGREYIGCGIVFLAVLLSQLDIDAIKNKLKKQNKDN